MSIPLANTLSEQVDTCIFAVIEKKSYSVGKSSTNPRNFLYAIKLLMKPLSPACFSFNIFLESHTHGPWVYKSGTGASFIFGGTSLGGSGLAGRGGEGAGRAHSLLGLRVSAAGSYFSVLPLVSMNPAINAYM